MIMPDSLAGTYFSDDLFFYFSLLLMKLKKHDLKGINKDFRYWEKMFLLGGRLDKTRLCFCGAMRNQCYKE